MSTACTDCGHPQMRHDEDLGWSCWVEDCSCTAYVAPTTGSTDADLRERIAQAIEAEADPHVVGDYGMGHNAATYQAAQIARNTP